MQCPIYIGELEKCPETFNTEELLRDHLFSSHQMGDIANRLIGIIDSAERKMKEIEIEDNDLHRQFDTWNHGFWWAMYCIVNPHDNNCQ